MKIDFANLKYQYQLYKKDIDNGISRVLENSNYIMGNEINEFEEELKHFTSSKFAYSCSSGTDALILALMAIDIKPGDEVITTSFSFISTAETIALLGAKPVFVDVEEDTYNIDVSQIEKKINKKTKAIISVSLYGQTSDIDAIDYLANKYKITHIIDGAQSFGAKYKDKYDSNLGHISTTSFFPSKPLGCYGDGGAIFTNSDEYAEKIKAMRVHGQIERYNHKYIGIGGRLDTIQAAVLSVKLKNYQNEIELRQNVASYYDTHLTNSKFNFTKPIIREERNSVWAQYTLRSENREEIMQCFKENSIPITIHYPRPLHLQDCFKYLNYQKGDLPISEKSSNQVFSIPMNPFLTKDQIIHIAKIIS